MNVELEAGKSEAGESLPDDPIRKLSHDVRDSLHAMRTGLDLLKASPVLRDADPAHRLAEILQWMDRDLSKVAKGVEGLVAMARNGSQRP